MLFLLFIGTQVDEGLQKFGKPMADFLTEVALWIGQKLN